MFEYLSQIEDWHWLVLGVVLLGLEALGAGGFLLGAAIAAITQALIVWIWPDLGWQLQFVVFALLSVVFTIGYWRYFKGFNDKTDHQQINNRAAQMIGTQLQIEEDIPMGVSRLQIGDTSWKIFSDKVIDRGSNIKVIANEGMQLQVMKVE